MTKDGGKTWILDPGIKDDFHDIWICPKDPNRMIATNDGGCQVSMTRRTHLVWSIHPKEFTVLQSKYRQRFSL